MIARSNYILTQEFLGDLREVDGLNPKSIARYRFHLRHLLIWSFDCPFVKVMNKRPTLLSYVKDQIKQHGGSLSHETQSRIIETAKRFFTWAKLKHEAEFRNMPAFWIESLKMPKTETQQGENEYISLDEILQIARLEVPAQDLVLQREQAAAVMLFLSGMRAGAFTSAPIQAFDLVNRCVYQWPKEYGVRTKNSKKATTYLLPIPELLQVVTRWDERVQSVLPPTDPWYAPIRNEWGMQEFSHQAIGENRGAALNKRLKALFALAGLPYRSAHKFRHGHAVYGRQNAANIEDYKAVSQNMMHNDLSITDGIYARMLTDDVGKRIGALASQKSEAGGTEPAPLSKKQMQRQLLQEMLRELENE